MKKIGAINKIENVGKFQNCQPARLQFAEDTIIYGRNTQGKSTLTAIFRSLKRGNPKVEFHAGRLMIEEIKRHVLQGDSFAFETTLSGKTYAIRQRMGYSIKLVFLYLPDVKIAIERVKYRVEQGGHNIPEKIIIRRHEKGWQNFQFLYKHLVDAWILFDNSGMTPRLLHEGEKA